MRRSIATVSLSGTLRQKLEAVAAAKFDAVELFEPDFISFPGDAHEVRRIADGLGLAVDLYQPFRDFEGMPDEPYRRALDRAERKFDLMQILGAPLMLVCSNTSPVSTGDPELAASQLHELADLASRRDLRIGFEALAWGRWVSRYAQAWRIVEMANHSNLGLILDSFHTLSLEDDPTGIASIPGEKIFFVQMADAPLMSMDVLQWARHYRNFPGQGQLDVESFFESALRAGYSGTLSLEIFNDLFRSTPNRRTALDAMRSLLYLESQVRQRLMKASGSMPPDRIATRALERVVLFEPPLAARFDGFSFLEFGVDDAAEASLARLLAQFGFVRQGSHRTKNARLYAQGDIRLVLNAEPLSAARMRFDEQGPSVSVIGLSTTDPNHAARRGGALLSARADSARGTHELDLPAIVAPGGTTIHFVPSGLGIDSDFGFDAEASETSSGGPELATVGLAAIDHITIGLAADQLDTWTLFGRSVLGLSAGESLDVADPFGLIRSHALSNTARTLRLVLNVSLGAHTQTARQVSATGRHGAGVNNIAFSCSDIFKAVAQAKVAGARFVAVSSNYYDDLSARQILDEDLIRKMQLLDVLFDGMGGGRYFHAYGEPFEDRFFFEIVQREAYDGYGAQNAAVRMAARAE